LQLVISIKLVIIKLVILIKVVILSGTAFCPAKDLSLNHSRPRTASSPYQDDFATPGISPRSASPRKHKRHMPNLRRNARGRPQIWQRLCRREENFGVFAFAVRATSNFFSIFASFTRFAVVMKSFVCSNFALNS
jgi:hypothetical protein